MTAATARVVFLTNFIPPYRVPVLRSLADRVGHLTVLVSTPMEANRDWEVGWGELEVEVQRGVSIPRRWRHPGGFRERLPLHVPVDTFQRLGRLDPAVVLSAELGARTAQAAFWCGIRRRPLVVWATLSERTEEGRGGLRRRIRRRLLRRAAGVVVNGESGARYIAGYGVPEHRIHRVNQASPVAGAGAEPGSAEGPLRLLHVGQLVERKGLEPFIRRLDAWCERRRVSVRLTLVGSGPLSERLRSLRTSERLDLRVDGPVPFNRVARLYGAADLLVFPTLADEWGLVVNEAMACGLPVLGSIHAQAVTELVEDGVTGWRFDPESPAEPAGVLDRVLDGGRARIRAMGATARRRIAALTPDLMADRLYRTLEDVLSGDRRRP